MKKIERKYQIYLIAILIHIVLIYAWFAYFGKELRDPGTMAMQTFFGAQLGYWFFALGLQIIMNYHFRNNNRVLMLLMWFMMVIVFLGFGLTGVFGFLGGLWKGDPKAIMLTINIFWAYGLFQVLSKSFRDLV